MLQLPNKMKKQEYMKPQMKIVKIQQPRLLCGSPYPRGAKSLADPRNEGFKMPDGGIFDDDDV